MLLNLLRRAVPQRHPLRLSWHFFKAFLAALLYGFPARNLTVVGITGTDGKTTTVGMVTHILEHVGLATGSLSTASFTYCDHTEWNTTQKTSPSPFTVQRFLRKIISEGCTHAVLEYSSHGLVQGRTLFTWPRVAAITNTAMEHLDYHGSLEQYRKDKGKIFRMLRSDGTKVLNTRDETFELYSKIPSASTIAYEPTHQLTIHLRVPGAFNRENALCAIACTEALGMPREVACKALESFEGVPGRFEKIDEGQPFSVYVDFTVTPQAYEKTLRALRELHPQGRILVLTGSCGDRMREKRPMIGKICSELSDIVVVTNEDPYTEDPWKIIEEVFAGIDQGKVKAWKIFDRKEAMEFLFSKAQPGDAVILCAKGSDTTMWTKEGKIPWNEREIARELLRGMRAKPQSHERPPRENVSPQAALIG